MILSFYNIKDKIETKKIKTKLLPKIKLRDELHSFSDLCYAPFYLCISTLNTESESK